MPQLSETSSCLFTFPLPELFGDYFSIHRKYYPQSIHHSDIAGSLFNAGRSFHPAF